MGMRERRMRSRLLNRSVRREAVQQTSAARLGERIDAAARGLMRGIPRHVGDRVGIRAVAVVVAEHDGALAALRVIAARHVIRARERGAVGPRTGQDVVLVRRVASTVDDFTFLSERRLLAELVRTVQLVEVVRDDLTLRLAPWSLADPIARVDG